MEDRAKYEIKAGQQELLNERGHLRTCRCDECQHRDCDNCDRPEVGQCCPMPSMDVDTCLGDKSRPFWRPKTEQKSCRTCGRRLSAKDLDCPLDIDAQDECVRDFWSMWEPENSNYDGAEFEVEAEDNVKYDPKSRYYDAGGLEVLDIIRAKLTPEQYQGFCLGNAIKYTCRANHKGDYDRDLEKACFYAKEAR